MRNNDRSHALLLELQHQVQERLGILLVQRRCRLIENEQLCVLGQGLCDLHKLLFTGSNIFDKCTGRLFQSYTRQVFVRLPVCPAPVNGKGFPLLIAQIHILADRHLRHKSQLLVDDNDPFFFAVFDLVKLTNFTVVYDIPLVAPVRVDTAQNIHQCGFSGSVLPHEGVDLAFLHLQIYIVKCLDARESLGNIFHLQQDFCQFSPSLSFIKQAGFSLPACIFTSYIFTDYWISDAS